MWLSGGSVTAEMRFTKWAAARYGYPADVVARARATTDDLVAALTAGVEPFGAVGPARLAAYIATG
jgi:hypothetical protein